MEDNLDKIGCEERTAKASYHVNFLNTYEKYFKKFKDSKPTIVEIGVYKGASLRTWLRYFDGARVIGFDINEKRSSEHCPKECELIVGDQSKQEDLEKIPSADIIVDDGSHLIDHFVKTFFYLYDNRLKDGGLYIIEDLHCIYQSKKYAGNSPEKLAHFLKYLDDKKIKHKLYDRFVIIFK